MEDKEILQKMETEALEILDHIKNMDDNNGKTTVEVVKTKLNNINNLVGDVPDE